MSQSNDKNSIEAQPVANVRWVPIDEVEANDYNPNSVAKVEMNLLYVSILSDGYTQPVVTIVDKRCAILLPCGHKTEIVNQSSKIWDTISPLPRKSHIRRAFLMQTEQLQSFMANYSKNEKADTEFKSPKQLLTTENKSVNDFEKHGESEEYIIKSDYVKSIFGTSLKSTILDSYSLIVCHICKLKDDGQKNYWYIFQVEHPTGEDTGLLVSCNLSEVEKQQESSLKDYEEAKIVSEQKGVSLVYKNLNGILESTLVIIDKSKVIIVDGFHRFYVMKTHKDIYDRTGGLLPIVTIDKDINDRMASTIRHNRARDKHGVQGMSHLVFKMLENGWTDEMICNELGMEAEEILRLKHITGFSKLFENTEYRKAWESINQVKIRIEIEKTNKT